MTNIRPELIKKSMEALLLRIRWPSLHWGVEDVHSDAWPTLVESVLEAVADDLRAEGEATLHPLLRDLIDEDDCRFDHNGGCQSHGYLYLRPGDKCPHAEAKEILSKASLRVDTSPEEETVNKVFNEDGYDLVLMRNGTYLTVHAGTECEGRNCSVHNPSDHPLKNAPLHWRGDRKIMERICEHGVGHDDFDDLAYRKSIGREHDGIHGCDGCCRAKGGPRE